MYKLADYLLSPLKKNDNIIKEKFIDLLEGKEIMVIFSAICVLCIEGAYFKATKNFPLTSVILPLSLILAVGRISTTRGLTSCCSRHIFKRTWFVLTGLSWAILVGMVSAICISTKIPSLMMLGSSVVSGFMFGALFMNSSAPRFSIIQSALFITPPVVTCWATNIDYKNFFVFLFPLWYGGAILITIKMYFFHKKNIVNQNQIFFLANHDQLTGLKNRFYLTAFIKKISEDEMSIISHILLLDLDGFKIINDKFGHSFGDEILKEVSLRLISSVRSEDCVARLGGDEFVIIINNACCAQLHNLAKKLIFSVSAPFVLSNGKIVQVGVSIGGTSLSKASAHKALEKADKLMYVAKSRRDNSIFIDCGP